MVKVPTFIAPAVPVWILAAEFAAVKVKPPLIAVIGEFSVIVLAAFNVSVNALVHVNGVEAANVIVPADVPEPFVVVTVTLFKAKLFSSSTL